MKGNNELRLNQATMVDVLQLWVDAQFTKNPPRVVSVEELSAVYSKEFSVKVTDEPKEGA